MTFVQGVGVHDARRIVEAGTAHHRTVHVPDNENKDKMFKMITDLITFGIFLLPVDVIGDQRQVETEREPLPGEQEQQVEEDVQDVLGQDQGVQGVALVNRVLVVRL